MTRRVNRKGVQSLLLILFLAAAAALFVEGVMGGAASQLANQKQIKDKSCPANPACDAIVRSLSATEDRAETPAIRGESISPSGVGVLGVLTSTTSTFGTGVRGESPGKGVHGISSQIVGVQGDGPIGVAGFGSFVGVEGLATPVTGDTTGVRGETLSFSGSGVLGIARASGTPVGDEGQNFGVRGESASRQGTGVFGLVTHSTGENIGVRGESGSADGVGVWAANTAGGTGLMVTGNTVLGADVQVTGNLVVGGAKSSVAELRDGRKVALYAVESTENWFEDFGSAKLQNGAAIVRIKEDFAQTVNTGVDYHIFLTPKGDCNGLYVANQTSQSFEVRELNGGTSNTLLDYRIVAKRRGHETNRLREVSQSQQLPSKPTMRTTASASIERRRGW